MKQTFLILLLMAVGCSTTPKTQTPAAAPEAPVPEFIEHFPGPPAPKSAEDEVDHQTLLKLQNTRTSQECARATSEIKISLASYYGLPYGILSEKEVATLTPFFQDVSQSAWKLIGIAKKKWKRVRPYDAYPDLHPCVSKETSFSYPSGHSAISRFYYLLLLNFYPEQQPVLFKRSDEIATDRTIGGVHYPTDIRDGKRLGEEIYDYLVKNERLNDRIHEFKKTLKTVH